VVLERVPRGADAEHTTAGRMLRSARWGLVPSWAKDGKIGNRLINARSETITEKPAFKTAAAARRRCLVPAAGYYEWEKADGRKVPYFLHRDHDLLAFAGLYELWPDPALTDPEQVRELLTAIPEPRLEPYEVSPAVNSPGNNGPELVQPLH
jgi:putative SOS response-associated peptidase YedK